MKTRLTLLLLLVSVFQSTCLFSQVVYEDTFRFSGQASGWGHFNPDNDHKLYIGGRYIPQINIGKSLTEGRLLDCEGSLNIVGDIGTAPFDTISTNGTIKPYRLWARYSSNQFEARAGLQKINFGSAQIIRPLMWFDQVDSRDPLQMTDGVWGGLARYYFLNNANIWFWALYGNNDTKGWEWAPTSDKTIELGGRIQAPISMGEMALSYHHRKANAEKLSILWGDTTSLEQLPEHRLAFDIRMDMFVGIWLEASWTNINNKMLGLLQNQELINFGLDYTFGIGNGLACTAEHIINAIDENPFHFETTTHFSALMASYTVGMFDNISTIFYADWMNDSFYSFVNWQHDFSALTLYTMTYWNPSTYNIPTPGEMTNLYGNVGLQMMIVFNH